MKDLIEDWEQNAQEKADSTFDFLIWLKTNREPDRVDSIANEAHEEIFSKIDCTNCANCCKTLSPQIDQTDIERIASFLGISEAEFIEKYLKIIGENNYEMNSLPCPFLEENKCTIYDIRPTVCREYPHTNKQEFASRKYMHSGNAEICPAVYHILETMKKEIGWRD
jgi:Fe-S-cluster containining protein